jgi:8-oxo-dGTP pyrophosphatase MutT (NUDIX family)
MSTFKVNDILNFNAEEFVALFGDRLYSVLNSENPFSRTNQFGHITASGLLVHENKVLLIFHPFINKWFQPGGHIDDGESPIEAAIREVYEETGCVCVIDSADLEPIDIDVHEIPANPLKGEGTHLHIDLLYRLKLVREDKCLEDISCGWFSFDEVQSTRIKRALLKLSSQSLK